MTTSMAMTITFDTLAYCKTLQSAGMSQQQAEAMAKAQKAVMEELVAAKELATQADILRLENRMESNKHELLKWMMGMLVAQSALIVAVITILK